MTTTNQQVKLLMKKLKKYTQEVAAAKSGMDVKTARKYIKSGQLPSEMKKPRTWKTRRDPFADDWSELAKMLENAPGLQAKTLMNYLLGKSPDKYKPSQVRTLQRRINHWRAEHGADKPVIFNQTIKPGKQSQSDYTCMNKLNITLNDVAFPHLLFHFMLPYSHWESIALCFSESFDSLVMGFEKAVWSLGCCAPEHRTDNLSAATQAMGSRREFTQRWQQVMNHYQIKPTTNNPGVSHENGSVEKSHDNLKTAIDQALLLRGSRDFINRESYVSFLDEVVETRNYFCKERLLEELDLFQELPEQKWHAPTVLRTRVSSGSIIQIFEVPYSVPSRLIHYTLTVYVYPDEIVLFYGQKCLQRIPRVDNNSLKGINYRHLIDSLVRKPGAFANYRYQAALFPRFCFRQAYDCLRLKRPASADREYLKILQQAKIQSEQSVSDALSLLLEAGETPTLDSVKSLIDTYDKTRLEVSVDEPNLASYDSLLSSQENAVGEIH